MTEKRKRDFNVDLCSGGTPHFYRGCCEHDYRRSFIAFKMREGIEQVIFDESAGKIGPRQRREADLANTSIYKNHQIYEHRGATQLETSPKLKDGSWTRSVSALIAPFFAGLAMGMEARYTLKRGGEWRLERWRLPCRRARRFELALVAVLQSA